MGSSTRQYTCTRVGCPLCAAFHVGFAFFFLEKKKKKKTLLFSIEKKVYKNSDQQKVESTLVFPSSYAFPSDQLHFLFAVTALTVALLHRSALGSATAATSRPFVHLIFSKRTVICWRSHRPNAQRVLGLPTPALPTGPCCPSLRRRYGALLLCPTGWRSPR